MSVNDPDVTLILTLAYFYMFLLITHKVFTLGIYNFVREDNAHEVVLCDITFNRFCQFKEA